MRVVAEEALGVEGAALDVAGEVADGGFALARWLKLDVPLCLWTEGVALVGGEFLRDVRVVVFEGVMDEAAEAGSERGEVDEEVVGLFWVGQFVVFRVVGDGRNDAVDVRVVLHLTAPGMEDAGEAQFEVGCFKSGGGDVVEGLGAAFEEKVVKFLGMAEAEGAELRGDREGDEEVRDS